MAQITLRGNPINTVGELPAVGSPAPAFELVGADLGPVTSDQYRDKPVILNIFPSIDTPSARPACAPSTSVPPRPEHRCCVSPRPAICPEAFRGAEGIENVGTASAFRSSFGEDFGVTIADGPMTGLLGRAIVVIGADGNVAYTELVPEIAQEPDYDAVLGALS